MAADTQWLDLATVTRDKEEPSLYVVNSSSPKGNITFEVSDGMGGKQSILIPTTWVPIDLTTQGQKASVLSSPQFRRLLAAGLLKIPSAGHIKSLQAKSGYAQESAKAYNNLAATEGFFQGEMSPAARAVVEGEKTSGFILSLVASEDVDESEVLNTLTLREDELTEDDVKYLLNNSKHAKVKAWAAERAKQD
jgi:hypothetical protein